jgi:hypothetical protein
VEKYDASHKRKKIILVNFLDDVFLTQVAKSFGQSLQTYNFSFTKDIAVHDGQVESLVKIIPFKIKATLKGQNLSNSQTKLNKDYMDVFISMIDRVSTEKWSGREILSYHRQLLTYFEAYFQKNHINNLNSVVVFDSTPHMPWDIVLYALAQHLKIKTIIPRSTNLSHTIQFATEFEFEKPLEFTTDRSILTSTSSIIENQYAQDLIKLQQKVKAIEKKTSKNNFYLNILLFIKLGKALFLNSSEIPYFRVKNFFGTKIYFDFFINIIRAKRKLVQLSSKKPNLATPFIFYALHAQPEKTTDPDSGIYSNQILAIEKIRTLIPDNWRILVKEHPIQFDMRYVHVKQLRFRSPEFYESIDSISNVQFVSTSTPSEILIEEAQVVATGTGSVAWEAVLKGKRILLFGNSWLSKHPNCINVDNFDPRIVSERTTEETKENNLEYINKISSTLVNSCNSKYVLGDPKESKMYVQNFVKAVVSVIE